MRKIKELFGNYEMTWKRLIIFSLICGVYTALVLVIPIVKDSALREIGVGYECWFILAIFVVSNCKDWKEAAIKTFVFFLISQPLVYLVQMIFVDENLLAEYYYPWFKQTILTLPGGAIAYQIKRNDVIGSIILSVAGSFIAMSGGLFFIKGYKYFDISYLIYGIALIAFCVLFGLLFCRNKRSKIVYFIITSLIAIVICGNTLLNLNASGKYEHELSKENWDLGICTFNNINVEIEDDVLIIEYYARHAKGEIELTNENNDKIQMEIVVDNGKVTLTEK